MATIISALKKSVLPRLQVYGFRYAGKPDSESWRFTRSQNGVSQNIDFVKSQHFDRAMRIDLSTTIEPFGVEIYHLIAEPRPEDGWWHFTDEHDLELTLAQLTKLALTYGFPYLEVASLPVQLPPLEPTLSMLSNPQEHALAFCRLAGIAKIATSELERLDAFIRQAPREDAISDWAPVLGATAFLGEVFRQEFGGTWQWSDDHRTVVVGGIGGKIQEVLPLIYVCVFWSRRNERDSLSNRFAAIAAM